MRPLTAFKTALLTSLTIALVSGGLFVAGNSFAGYGAGSSSGGSADTDGKVAIHTPEDGSAINGTTVVVSYEIVDKGTRGNHVHLYLDGKLVKPLYGVKNQYTIKSVGKGEHTIEVKLATKGHTILAPKAMVKITVE